VALDRHRRRIDCIAERRPRRLRDERLAAARERHDARRDRLGDALDLDRLGAARNVGRIVLAQRHRADMDAGASEEAERRDRVVVRERERRRLRGVGEEEEEAVAVVDLAAAVAGEEGARGAIVLGEDARRARVAEPLDERGAVDQIGEKQRVRVHATASRTSRLAPTDSMCRCLPRAARPERRPGVYSMTSSARKRSD
jgi:hypothetical protein